MKETRRNRLMLVGFVAVLLYGFQFGSAQQGKQPTATWEYKVLDMGGSGLDHGDAANHWTNSLSPYADEGWELVSMTPAMQHGRTTDMFATMKRLKK